jgi:L-ascorbate metabolism protein UlaG (beta-lactamase superfamily)
MPSERPGKRSLRWTAPAACGALLTMAILSTCMSGPRMPAMDGAVIELRRSDRSIERGEAGFADALQLSWFGSGCHLIRLGELSVLTDPFVSNGPPLAYPRSRTERVNETLGMIAPPEAVLINHSHFDHFLDAYPALALEPWRKARVPLYGGMSCRNLVAGWKDDDVTRRCHVIENHGGKVRVHGVPSGYKLEVTAYPGTHGPHLKCGYTAFDGKVEQPLTSPPESIDDYKTGEVFNYLIKLTQGTTSFTVFYLGAIGDLDAIPTKLPGGDRLDVVLLCAPGADKVPGYPAGALTRLKARHVVLSHFNTFLKEDPDEQLSFGGKDMIHFDKLSREIQASGLSDDYKEFEKLHIPAITRMEEDGRARNVVRLR